MQAKLGTKTHAVPVRAARSAVFRLIFFSGVDFSTGFARVIHSFSTPGCLTLFRRPPYALPDMLFPRAWLCAAALLLLSGSARAAEERPALLRIFLHDGSSFTSYGEWARVDGRVVFPLPLASGSSPDLRLVTIAAERVDWPRTERYAAAARAAHYAATRGEADYERVTSGIAARLNTAAKESDPTRRLGLMEEARRVLLDWPARHYGYRRDDVREMTQWLDEIVSQQRAVAGQRQFEIGLVAELPVPPVEPLVAPPDDAALAREIWRASELADTAVERVSLLQALLAVVDRAGPTLPADWASDARRSAEGTIAVERQVEASYVALRTETLVAAPRLAGRADVRGLERLRADVFARDARLGARRPAETAGLVTLVDQYVTAARALRLAMDRYELQKGSFRTYRRSLTPVLDLLRRSFNGLEDIRAQAGPPPRALTDLRTRVDRAQGLLERIGPPNPLEAVHTIFGNAVALASSAITLRLDAILQGDLDHAARASAAAAGALMLAERAYVDLEAALEPPRLQ